MNNKLKELIEDFIFESIKENVFSDASIKFVVKSLTERLKSRTPGSASDIKKRPRQPSRLYQSKLKGY